VADLAKYVNLSSNVLSADIADVKNGSCVLSTAFVVPSTIGDRTFSAPPTECGTNSCQRQFELQRHLSSFR